MNSNKLEGKYANYFMVGNNEDVFVIDYYQFFPEGNDEEFDAHLQNSPKFRIIISPSDAIQLMLQLKSAIEGYNQKKEM